MDLQIPGTDVALVIKTLTARITEYKLMHDYNERLIKRLSRRRDIYHFFGLLFPQALRQINSDVMHAQNMSVLLFQTMQNVIIIVDALKESNPCGIVVPNIFDN